MILIDGFEVDVALSEGHTYESDVAEEPIESGSQLADHIANAPHEVVLEGIVSDSPLGALADRRGDLDGDGALASRPSSAAWAHMLAIRERRQPVTIVDTEGRTHESMGLLSLRKTEDGSTGEALRFTATFRHMRIVVNKRTVVTVAEPRAQKRRDLGSKPSPVVASSNALPPKVRPAVDTTKPPIRSATAGGATATSTTGGRRYGPPASRTYGPPAPLPGRIVMCRAEQTPRSVMPVDFFSGGVGGGAGAGRSF